MSSLAVILSREALAVILSREALAVILSREATKGSLSIQGFYGRGATAILSLASLAQGDYRGRFATQDDPQGLARSG